MEKGAVSRLHYLDALRVLAMALVVPWHAGVFLAVHGQGGIGLAGALWFSHSFRMPLFFLLAGFFGASASGRRSHREWLRGRMVRLSLPLAIGVVVLAPLIGLFDEWSDHPGQSPVSLAGLAHPRPDYLWFIWYLLILSVACVAIRTLARRIDGGATGRILHRCGSSPAAIALLAIPCATALWFTDQWQAAPPDSFLVPAGLIAYYAIFFTVGWLLGDRATGLEVLGAHPQRRLATAVIVAVPAFWLFAHAGDPGIADDPAIRFAALYLAAICCWCLVAAGIGLCRRHLSAERHSMRYAADASYWLYLSHMLFLVPLQLLLVGLLPGPVQLAVAVVTTFALALLTYELFVRYSAIGSVLHGPRRRAYELRLPWRLTRLPTGAAARRA